MDWKKVKCAAQRESPAVPLAQGPKPWASCIVDAAMRTLLPSSSFLLPSLLPMNIFNVAFSSIAFFS